MAMKLKKKCLSYVCYSLNSTNYIKKYFNHLQQQQQKYLYI